MLGRAGHWCVRNRLPFVMEPIHFGDQYYYDEGFITTALHTSNESLRTKINEAIRHRVHGTCGLLATLGERTWWPVDDECLWIKAKSAGMPQTLLYARAQGGTTGRLEEALADMQRILCTPEYARRIGVMPEDAERPASIHGYNTWSGMQIEATGFAGQTIAEMIKPGVLYLVA
jgi:hypothetical protein